MKHILRFAVNNKSAFLLLVVLLLLLLEPFMINSSVPRVIIALSYTAMLLLGPYFLTANRKILWLSMIVGIPAILSKIAIGINVVSGYDVYLDGLVVVFTSIMTCCSVYYTSTSLARPTEAIAGSALAYLLLGVCFAEIFAFINMVYPGSFTIGDTAVQYISPREMLYFSLVTLTTLGYGEFLPATPLARRMASIESVVGVLYIAVFLGRVISVMRREEEENESIERINKPRLRKRYPNRVIYHPTARPELRHRKD